MTDERDLHDANVDAAWRAHMHAAPPAALDAGILAAAHRAVQSAPRSADDARRPRHRAWVPLAVAATLGAIAFGVVQLAPHETDRLTSAVSDAPVVTARKQEAAPPTHAEAPRSEESADRGGIAAQRAAEQNKAQTSSRPADQSTAQAAQSAADFRQQPADVRRTQRNDLSSAAPAAPAPEALGRSAPGAPAETVGRTATGARRDGVAQTAPTAPAPGAAPPASTASTAPATPAPDAQPMREREAFPATVPVERKTAPLAAPEATRAPAPPPARALAPAPAPQPAPEPAQSGVPAAPALPTDEDAAARLRKDQYADKLAANVAPAPPPRAAAPAPVLRDAPAESRSGALRAENARAKVKGTRAPEDFVREIRRLRAEGRDADAGLALAAFRAAYDDADARLPDDLRAWARTVARP